MNRLDTTLFKTWKMLQRILGILIAAYLAFFFYVALHEWAGHILADGLVYAVRSKWAPTPPFSRASWY